MKYAALIGLTMSSTMALSNLQVELPPPGPRNAPADSATIKAGVYGDAPRLDWQLCAEVADEWPIADDDRTECAELRVPMDYAKPDGRMITVAVSRAKATDPGQRRGALVLSPGGPGIFNLDAPRALDGRPLGELASDFDIVGLDPRGAGHSDKVDCEVFDAPETPTDSSERQLDRAMFDYNAEFNQRCAATDPEFVATLTPANVARDIDLLRAALGEEKISFYGVSFGTAYGTSYRSLFDSRVERMWLDSPVPPTPFDLAAMDGDQEGGAAEAFEKFVAWLAGHDREFHFGTTEDAVRTEVLNMFDRYERDPVTIDGVTVDGLWVLSNLSPSGAHELAALRDTGRPLTTGSTSIGEEEKPRTFGLGDPRGGLNSTQYAAMFCQESVGPLDFDAMWSAKQDRKTSDPITTGGQVFTAECADWPLERQPIPTKRGTSPLQISGHIDEGITPYVWATQLHDAAGGELLTVLDDAHASLSRLPCASKAIDFFRDGTPATGTCPGLT